MASAARARALRRFPKKGKAAPMRVEADAGFVPWSRMAKGCGDNDDDEEEEEEEVARVEGVEEVLVSHMAGSQATLPRGL